MDIEAKKAADLAAARGRVGLPAGGESLVGTWRNAGVRGIFRVNFPVCDGDISYQWLGESVEYSEPAKGRLFSCPPATPREVWTAFDATLTPEQRARVGVWRHSDEKFDVFVDSRAISESVGQRTFASDLPIDTMLAAVRAALAKPAPVADRPAVGSVHPWPVARADMEAHPDASYASGHNPLRIRNGVIQVCTGGRPWWATCVNQGERAGSWTRLPDEPEQSTAAEGDTPAEPHKSEAGTTCAGLAGEPNTTPAGLRARLLDTQDDVANIRAQLAAVAAERDHWKAEARDAEERVRVVVGERDALARKMGTARVRLRMAAEDLNTKVTP